jgi:transposase-like protein
MSTKKIPTKTKSKASVKSKSKRVVNPLVKKDVALEKVKSNRGCKGYNDMELTLKLYSAEIPKGLNNLQIAKYLGISHETFYQIIKRSSDFSDAIKFYTGESNLEVLKSFKNLACGYSFTEQEKELRRDKESGEYKLTITKEIKKHVPANASAGIFYLKNKMPEHFKDKIETAHTFTEGLENITFVIKSRDK